MAPFWLILGPVWSNLGADLGYFVPSGVSSWFVWGEIQFLKQKFVKKHCCIDPGIRFLAYFRMQTIFPRPGGGTIAAGNRDRSSEKVGKMMQNRRCAGISFGPILAPIFHQKIDEQIDAKIDAEKVVKLDEN